MGREAQNVFEQDWRVGLARGIAGRIGRGAVTSSFWKNTFHSLSRDNPILEWPISGRVSENWGDRLNPALVILLSGIAPVPRSQVWNPKFKPIYYMIGSSLGGVSDPNAVIYGTGFLEYQQRPKILPRQVVSVRGPLSAKKYKDAGLSVALPVGDMALALPYFYRPSSINKTHRLGVISHFRERGLSVWDKFKNDPDVRFIDICSPIRSLIHEILHCDVIASSSLHGLIAANAYDVPTVWLRASDSPRGDFFKFHDYLLSIGKEAGEPLIVTDNVTVMDIINRAEDSSCPIDIKELVELSPFGGVKIQSANAIEMVLDEF